MTEEEMRKGLAAGRILIQTKWADPEWEHPEEARIIDKLIAEGFAEVSAWEYQDNFQCEHRRVYKKP